MPEFSAITYIHEKSTKDLLNYLKQEQFEIFELNGAKISDAKSFFGDIIKVLPQDPPLSGSVCYDALVDSLWGGFDELGKEKVALIWNESEKMMNADSSSFMIITQCFSNLFDSLNTVEYGLEKPIIFLTFMVGKGERFKEFIK